MGTYFYQGAENLASEPRLRVTAHKTIGHCALEGCVGCNVARLFQTAFPVQFAVTMIGNTLTLSVLLSSNMRNRQADFFVCT